MLTGLKSKSDLLFISQELNLPDGGTAQTLEVNLPLNTLERQVFVVTDIMVYYPNNYVGGSGVVANNTGDFSWSVSSTDLDSVLGSAQTGDISNPRVLAAGGGKVNIGATGEVVFREWGSAMASTGTPSDYLGIIATPDFYIRAQNNDVLGSANTNLQVRVVGYMAIASADTYAALVTQEVNSQ